MKRYLVVTTPSAEADIIDSFIWGCENWSVEMAQEWALDIRSSIENDLSLFPLRFPMAPDDDGSGRQYRHMFVGRYRVIFHIEDDIVRVVHVRGAFVDSTKQTDLGVEK